MSLAFLESASFKCLALLGVDVSAALRFGPVCDTGEIVVRSGSLDLFPPMAPSLVFAFVGVGVADLLGMFS